MLFFHQNNFSLHFFKYEREKTRKKTWDPGFVPGKDAFKSGLV